MVINRLPYFTSSWEAYFCLRRFYLYENVYLVILACAISNASQCHLRLLTWASAGGAVPEAGGSSVACSRLVLRLPSALLVSELSCGTLLPSLAVYTVGCLFIFPKYIFLVTVPQFFMVSSKMASLFLSEISRN